jgi:hypothetical protein
MPMLTLSAPAAWRAWLVRRIDRHLQDLAAADPGLLARVARQARRRAWQSLGLAPLRAELRALAAQQRDLDRRARRAHQAALAVLRRRPPEAVADVPGSGRLPAEIRRALRRRQALHAAELLAAEALGPELLRWRREKAQVRETLALATAPAAVLALWRQTLAALGQEPTALQQAVLARADTAGP